MTKERLAWRWKWKKKKRTNELQWTHTNAKTIASSLLSFHIYLFCSLSESEAHNRAHHGPHHYLIYRGATKIRRTRANREMELFTRHIHVKLVFILNYYKRGRVRLTPHNENGALSGRRRMANILTARAFEPSQQKNKYLYEYDEEEKKRQRLKNWCAARNGKLGWCWDSGNRLPETGARLQRQISTCTVQCFFLRLFYISRLFRATIPSQCARFFFIAANDFIFLNVVSGHFIRQCRPIAAIEGTGGREKDREKLINVVQWKKSRFEERILRLWLWWAHQLTRPAGTHFIPLKINAANQRNIVGIFFLRPKNSLMLNGTQAAKRANNTRERSKIERNAE